MALRQIDGLEDYAELLSKEPEEIQALAQDFLIRVTGFFRDPETFAGLSETVFPALVESRSPRDPLRIWVPGCASGEEVYSIAIVLLEYLAERDTSIRIQIFGTDLSESAIEKARTGFYTDSIADEVSPERLQRFFVKLDDHYQISKTIRDLCVFARHDVTRDPPFSRLGLVSCRNLLIYLDQTMQRQIIPLFHYSLNPNGFLVLGAAESIGTSSELFRLVDGHRADLPKAAGTGTGCRAVPGGRSGAAGCNGDGHRPCENRHQSRASERRKKPSACCSRAMLRLRFSSTMASTSSTSMARRAATWSMPAAPRA